MVQDRFGEFGNIKKLWWVSRFCQQLGRQAVLAGLFALTVTISLTLHGCNSIQSAKLQPLKVGITTWPGFDIVLYAQSADLFQKHGLDVELVRFENQQDAARAVLRGSLDAAFASLWDTMQVDPGNDKPVFMLVTNVSHGADGIVAQAGVESIADLRKKQIGAKLSTVNHLILLEALKLHQVPPEEINIVDVSNETAAQLMEAGKLDAAVLWEPMLGDTAQTINGNVLYTTKDLDSLVIDGLMTRSELLKAKPTELTAFVLTWFDVMHAVDTRPDEVFAAVGTALGQSGEAFANDYAGLKKGDIAMQQQMFQQEGLKTATQSLIQLLQADPRHGRIPRDDIEFSTEPVMAAWEEWMP
ncbi:nitrate ABC transporter substrate-binding protein [filamentous cyanobacterium CCP2]|nr:nitrate ABC transporter substrate-binding protein [filamentous cyanobacterium CCP2]